MKYINLFIFIDFLRRFFFYIERMSILKNGKKNVKERFFYCEELG